MEDLKKELLNERTDLENRLENFHVYLKQIDNDKGSAFTVQRKALLTIQLNSMSSYLICLNERIG